MRYQSKRSKRQFLAGVKCPSCQKLDTVVQVRVFEPEPDEYIECTQCAHTERRPDPESINANINNINNEKALISDAMATKNDVRAIRFIK